MTDKKYQIFISSTYKDLIASRETIIKAILNLYHVPIGMEMFSADNEEQWETIKTTIQFSDYYVLIVGHRYGSTTKEGVSYTEKEFDYAKEIGVPILAFVRNREASTTPAQREQQPQNQEKLDTFVEKVTNNAMVDFWNDDSELATKVITALFKIFTKIPRIGWIRSDKGMSSEVADELAALSKENRGLKAELLELKNKISSKKPAFQIFFNDKDIIVEKLISNSTLIQGSKYYIQKLRIVPRELANYTSQDNLQRYNSSIDRNSEAVTEYNQRILYFERLSHNKITYRIRLKNIGNIKANNIVAEFEFPDEIIITNDDNFSDVIDFKRPLNVIPNPIHEAEMAKQRHLDSQNNYIFLGGGYQPAPINAKTLGLVKDNYTITNDKQLRLKFDHILHTQSESISSTFYVIPLISGNYAIKAKVICEEFEEPEEYEIPVIITEEDSNQS
ncbi:MAG: DUF4062 domain-containing protein [Bacteroidetes bacterium]|jgi:hypothetical protein|nr:DUF4062 domain-containing protein [Bacteroidota bacterium]